MANPIKYTDLFDSGVQRGVSDLKEAIEATAQSLDKMLENARAKGNALKEALGVANPGSASGQAEIARLSKEVEDLRFAAASAASLHEFAKEVFEIWQTQGIFARKRALKELRERAGFRLESHRIGNYVAKTFDLMNEAQARFARAQQALFSADVRYKIRPGVYARIYEVLTDKNK